MVKGIIHIGIWEGLELKSYAEKGFTHAILFEPIKSVYEKCMKNVLKTNTNFNTKFKCYNLAVSNENVKDVNFYVIKKNKASSSLCEPSKIWDVGTERYKRTGGVKGVIKVETVRFDTFIEKKNINLNIYKHLVIDVQGAEMKVLSSMDKYISNFDNIKIEVTKDNWKDSPYLDNCWFSDVNKFLTEKNFKLLTNEYYNDNWFHGDVEYIKI